MGDKKCRPLEWMRAQKPLYQGASGGVSERVSECVSVSNDQAGLAGKKVMCPESPGGGRGWCISNGKSTGGAGMLDLGIHARPRFSWTWERGAVSASPLLG